MQILIWNDIWPNVMNGLDFLLHTIKTTCVTEEEIYEV